MYTYLHRKYVYIWKYGMCTYVYMWKYVYRQIPTPKHRCSIPTSLQIDVNEDTYVHCRHILCSSDIYYARTYTYIYTEIHIITRYERVHLYIRLMTDNIGC